MGQQPDREARLVAAAKARVAAQQRHAEEAAEIAGKQAQLKREARQRRERREEQRNSR